jgi:hypothetical protein
MKLGMPGIKLGAPGMNLGMPEFKMGMPKMEMGASGLGELHKTKLILQAQDKLSTQRSPWDKMGIE